LYARIVHQLRLARKTCSGKGLRPSRGNLGTNGTGQPQGIAQHSSTDYNQDMNKKTQQHWWSSWPHLLLWSHVVGVIGFYILLWYRTNPYAGKRQANQKLKAIPPASSESGEAVSIIVPARNEERNIRRCVTSLLEQDYDTYEVIVVDDGSTDGTAGILEDIASHHAHGNRLRALHLRDTLPTGWAGKPHALHIGVQEACGDWLLFTDADTWHAPAALSYSLAKAQAEEIDLFSLGTHQELPGFWDRVMMPMAYLGISMQYPLRQVNDPDSPVAIANGQYILIRRSTYDILGGYARSDLRNTLLDDRDLARIVKENGFKLYLEDGRDLVHVHMYSGLREIRRGWRKNAFLGSRGGLLFALVQLIGLPMVSFVPLLLPLFARLTRGRNARRIRVQAITPREANAAMLLESSAFLAYRLWLDNFLNVPWYYALTHPLAGALFEGILAQSAWRVLTRTGIDWRGRVYYD
jgi:chlorobactene glucosyltransferase